jgi:membrane associated rhomboid family serine protease
MLPFRDVIPSRSAPIATLGLIALNMAIFLAGPGDGDWRPFLAALFRHDGWIQLVVNLWGLWLFGESVEDRLGRWRFLLLYGLAAAAALIPLWVASRPLLTVLDPLGDASGAVAGVIGGHLLLYPRSRMLVFVPRFFSIDLAEVPAGGVAGIWLAMQLFLSLGRIGDPAHDAGIALLAIAGAFGSGMGLTWVLRHRRRDGRWWDQH